AATCANEAGRLSESAVRLSIASTGGNAMKLLPTMLLLVATSQVLGADPAGKVEAKLNSEGDLWVGQRVPLTIEIFAPGFSMVGVPAFDFPDISGLLVVKLPGSPRIGNETIEDVTYVTQVHEFT